MSIIIGVFGLIFIIICCYFGAFNNDQYTNRYAKKYATPVKRHLDLIKRMEDANDVNIVASLYQELNEGIEAIALHYRISEVRGIQICKEAENRYINLHGEYLDNYQREALNRTLYYAEFYSVCLTNALNLYCYKMKQQIDALKTNAAKEKRRDKVIESMLKCANEIKLNGKPDYLLLLPVYGKLFNIEIDFKSETSNIQKNGLLAKEHAGEPDKYSL